MSPLKLQGVKFKTAKHGLVCGNRVGGDWIQIYRVVFGHLGDLLAVPAEKIPSSEMAKYKLERLSEICEMETFNTKPKRPINVRSKLLGAVYSANKLSTCYKIKLQQVCFKICSSRYGLICTFANDHDMRLISKRILRSKYSPAAIYLLLSIPPALFASNCVRSG